MTNKHLLLMSIVSCVVFGSCRGSSESTATTAVPEPSAVEESKTAIVFLLDISQSFAPLTKEDESALGVLTSDVVALAQKTWEAPVTLYWSMITSNSLYSPRVCPAIRFHGSRLVARSSTATDITRPDLLTKWMEECSLAIVKRSTTPEQFTDISGALQLAAESNRSVNGRRIIIVYSDFAEDLRPGSEPTRFVLDGETAIMLYRPDARQDRDKPNALFDRLKTWEEQLKAHGAKTVCIRPIRGITPGSVATCF